MIAMIQARLGSARYPGKILEDVVGKPLLQHVVDRAWLIPSVKVVAVVAPASDVSIIREHVSAVMFGPEVPEADVLGRFWAALPDARRSCDDGRVIMRLTGDCPLLDPRESERVCELFRLTDRCDYATNATPGYRDGEDTEIFTAALLEQACREATDAFDREHVTPWMVRHASQRAVLRPKPGRVPIKTSVDSHEDLERVRLIMEALT